MKGTGPTIYRNALLKQTRSLSMTAEIPTRSSSHLFSVAPMMEYTDKHQRALQRIMSKHTVLYTEMLVANALVRSGKAEKFLRADLDIEDPVVLQLGGSDPVQMKEAAKIAHDYGYKEINLNIGCPSEKVSGAGCFGAVLYHTPDLVSELAQAVGEATGKAATIKCRIGTDGHESYEELCNFIRTVSEKGKVTHFIVHARIAILGKKFTPKDNRSIPPLKIRRSVQPVTRLSAPELQYERRGTESGTGDRTVDATSHASRRYGGQSGRKQPICLERCGLYAIQDRRSW
jgi:tRNA dihydrouridine synthase A